MKRKMPTMERLVRSMIKQMDQSTRYDKIGVIGQPMIRRDENGKVLGYEQQEALFYAVFDKLAGEVKYFPITTGRLITGSQF